LEKLSGLHSVQVVFEDLLNLGAFFFLCWS